MNNKNKILILILITIVAMSIAIQNVSAANETTSKKESSIIEWDYYPISKTEAKIEYLVIDDVDKDGKLDNINYKDKIIQNINIKTFNINKQGTYKVNLYYEGNDQYKPVSKTVTVKFTGKEKIGGYSTNKLYKTYKKYGHTYKKYKYYWTTEYLNGNSIKKFDGYITKLVSGKKYRLLNSKKVNLKGSFFNKGMYKAYFNGDNKIKINLYGYYYPIGSFVKKYNKIGHILLNKKYDKVYYSYQTYNIYTFDFYKNSISKKLVNKFSKYL